MKRHIYVATVGTPLGDMRVAIAQEPEATPGDTWRDIMSATQGFVRCHYGMLRIKVTPSRSTRRILTGMDPIKNCVNRGEQWAWIKPA